MSAMAVGQTVSRWEESQTPPSTQPEIRDDAAGWLGWLAGLAGLGGGLLHPSFLSSICSALQAVWRTEKSRLGRFAFSPLCRGVSHQLALDEPEPVIRGSRGSRGSSGKGCGLLT